MSELEYVAPTTLRLGVSLQACLLQIVGYRNLIAEVEKLRREPYDSENPQHEEMLLKVGAEEVLRERPLLMSAPKPASQTSLKHHLPPSCTCFKIRLHSIVVWSGCSTCQASSSLPGWWMHFPWLDRISALGNAGLRAQSCYLQWALENSSMSYFSTPFSSTRRVFLSINQITNLFLQFFVFFWGQRWWIWMANVYLVLRGIEE